VLCLAGGVLGVGAGVALAMIVGQLAQWTVALQPLSFPLGVAVSLITGLVFGTVPAIQAARLDPVLALRVE
jgi:putative ABC transport system permease protein